MISDTVRIAYGNSSSLGNTGTNARSANAPCPISRRPGPLLGLVSPTGKKGSYSDAYNVLLFLLHRFHQDAVLLDNDQVLSLS